MTIELGSFVYLRRKFKITYSSDTRFITVLGDIVPIILSSIDGFALISTKSRLSRILRRVFSKLREVSDYQLLNMADSRPLKDFIEIGEYV